MQGEKGGRGEGGGRPAMELEVNSEAVAVETVEVVAGGEDGGPGGLQLMVTNAQDLIVRSAEVGGSR